MDCPGASTGHRGQTLPESQCGFQKGRGCIDMVFAARQMVEKSREDDAPSSSCLSI